MVILLCSTEHNCLWSSGKMQLHGQLQYCYLKGDAWASCDIRWKPRPESAVLVTLHRKKSRKYLFRNSRIRSYTRRNDLNYVYSGQLRDVYKNFISPKHGMLLPRHYLVDQTSGNKFINKASVTAGKKDFDEDLPTATTKYITEEPWLLLSSPLYHDIGASNAFSISCNSDEIANSVHDITMPLLFNGTSTFREKPSYKYEGEVVEEDHSSDFPATLLDVNYPVEEPWLCQYSMKSVSAETIPDVSKDVVPLKEADMHLASCDQHEQIPENGGTNIPEEDTVTTVILINSSICTMQRIAVLENEKLVELLLEPVKNNVLCDSVYVGVVTKLAPHMGGAFVNIGCSRLSFMDIKPKREPFVVPSFDHQVEDGGERSAVFENLGHVLGVSDNEMVPDGVDEMDDIDEEDLEEEDDDIEIDSIEYVGNDFLENVQPSHGDILGYRSENLNGSVIVNGVKTCASKHEKVNGNAHEQGNSLETGILNNELSSTDGNKWAHVHKGTKIIVQVVKEGLGTKGPTLTAYPKLKSRFWILITRSSTIGISKKISGVERTRLRVIAKTLQPPGFGLTVRTVASNHSLEELQKDLDGLLSTWKSITEHARSAALASDEGVNGAVPVVLHRAMGKTLSVVQDYFTDRVKSMVVDSPRTYHEVTSYLQEIAPNLCGRVELYSKKTPLFHEYKIEEEIDNLLGKRAGEGSSVGEFYVALLGDIPPKLSFFGHSANSLKDWVPLDNGGYLVIEQTEALVSIDVNGGHCMLGQGTSQEKAILDVNLAAAKQIARELRLRDIGGIIVVDFIDMLDDANKRLVYEEVKMAVERDKSTVKVSELSRHGLMEITRKRVRPSVTFMITEPCTCCHGTGRVKALETSFSKIEHEICQVLSMMDKKADPGNPQSWPRFILRVDRYMCNYLTSGKRTRLAVLSSSLKVWILLKVARGLSRGGFELKPITDDKEYNKQQRLAIPLLRPADDGTNTPSKKISVFPKKWKSSGK